MNENIMNNTTVEDVTVTTVNIEAVENMTVDESIAMSNVTPICTKYNEGLNRLWNELSETGRMADDAIWRRATLVARYANNDPIWEQNGISRKDFFASEFNIKGQTLANMTRVGSSPDFMKLRALGFSFTQVYEMSMLEYKRVRELISDNTLNASMTCKDIRDLIKSVKGIEAPKKEKKEKQRNIQDIFKDIQELVAELQDRGVNTENISKALGSTMLIWAEEQEG